jgi:hypothetical protein
MSVIDREELLFKIAATLLREHGELSIEDIRAIPFLQSQDKVTDVVNYLLREFNAEIVQRSVTNKPFLKWERIIRLRD